MGSGRCPLHYPSRNCLTLQLELVFWIGWHVLDRIDIHFAEVAMLVDCSAYQCKVEVDSGAVENQLRVDGEDVHVSFGSFLVIFGGSE